MKKNYLQTQIKKSALNKIILFAFFGLLIGCITYFGILSSNIDLLLNGVSKVKKVSELKEGTYINIEAKNVYDTGYDHTSDNKVSGIYAFIYLEDGYVIVQLPEKNRDLVGKENVKLTGRVNKLEDYEEKMIDSMLAYEKTEDETFDVEKVKSYFSGYKIMHGADELGSIILGYIGFAVVILFIALIYKQLIIYVNYKNSKLYKSIDKNTNAESLEKRTDDEIDNNKYINLNKRSVITDTSVFVFIGGSGFYKKAEELVWIYKVTTKHYTNGIPSGKSHGIKLLFNDKTIKDVPVKNEKMANELINKLADKYPDYMYGYSPDLAKMYADNPKNFINKVSDLKEKSVEDKETVK